MIKKGIKHYLLALLHPRINWYFKSKKREKLIVDYKLESISKGVASVLITPYECVDYIKIDYTLRV